MTLLSTVNCELSTDVTSSCNCDFQSAILHVNDKRFTISTIILDNGKKTRKIIRRHHDGPGIEDFLKVGETDDEHIIRTPEAWYRRVERPDLDVTVADSVFPELFELDYDKYVLTTISLQSDHAEPVYSMFINLPGNGKGNQRPFVI